MKGEVWRAFLVKGAASAKAQRENVSGNSENGK